MIRSAGRRMHGGAHALCCASARVTGRVRRRWRELSAAAESGMSTAEYAIGTIAACTFAAVLIAVVKSGSVSSALTKIITSALSIGT